MLHTTGTSLPSRDSTTFARLTGVTASSNGGSRESLSTRRELLVVFSSLSKTSFNDVFSPPPRPFPSPRVPITSANKWADAGHGQGIVPKDQAPTEERSSLAPYTPPSSIADERPSQRQTPAFPVPRPPPSPPPTRRPKTLPITRAPTQRSNRGTRSSGSQTSSLPRV